MKFQIRGKNLDLTHRVHIMGILNVTPNSFSDGGQFNSVDSIVNHAEKMIAAGVDIIDIGGESTRPYAEPVSVEEELDRVIPAIKAVRKHFQTPISIDTTKAEVARKSLEAGADIINDISAFRFDPEMVEVAKNSTGPIIIMHMQGTPGDMQVAPEYVDVVDETIDFFKERISWLVTQGINRDRIIIDPGIGFGKTLQHNLTILRKIDDYQGLKCPVLVGHSRKSFIGKILGNEVISRDTATAVLSGQLATRKVSIIRVHDVKSTCEAVTLITAVQNA